MTIPTRDRVTRSTRPAVFSARLCRYATPDTYGLDHLYYDSLVVYHSNDCTQLRPGVALINKASQQSRRTASSSIEQVPAEASHTETASHGMEISTGGRCVTTSTALCCAASSSSCRRLQEASCRAENLAGLLSHFWDDQTNRDHKARPGRTDTQPPVRPAWGEPKRARPSVPTQPPTYK